MKEIAPAIAMAAVCCMIAFIHWCNVRYRK